MAAARRRLGSPRRDRPSIVIVLALVGVLLSLPGLACRGASGDDSEAIHGLLKREVDAINARDLKALSEIWSQDPGILLFDVSPPGRFQGWDRIGRSFKDFFERFAEIHLTIDGVRVTVDGSLGYATYDWSMSGRMGTYALDDRGQATSVYRKESGGWRLVHAHYSAAPPGAAPANAATPGPPAATPAASPASVPSPR